MTKLTLATNQIQPTLSTIKIFCQRHPSFTVGGLRALIFNEKSNNLSSSGAIVRLGRKILIDENKFFNWIQEQNREG